MVQMNDAVEKASALLLLRIKFTNKMTNKVMIITLPNHPATSSELTFCNIVNKLVELVITSGYKSAVILCCVPHEKA
jgi:hypothetical protein